MAQEKLAAWLVPAIIGGAQSVIAGAQTGFTSGGTTAPTSFAPATAGGTPTVTAVNSGGAPPPPPPADKPNEALMTFLGIGIIVLAVVAAVKLFKWAFSSKPASTRRWTTRRRTRRA